MGGQFRLPAIALFSTLLLSRHYSVVQWQVISIITTSCMAFVLLKGQGREAAGKSWKWTGLFQIAGWVVLNVLGGIVAEYTYKGGFSGVAAPFYAQKLAEDCGHLLVSLAMLVIVIPRFQPQEDIFDRSKRPGGFFDGWDRRTVAVVVFLFLDAWLGNLLLKEFSGLTRSIAKAFGVAVVYFASFFYSKDRRSNPALTVVAILVIQSSLLFSFVS